MLFRTKSNSISNKTMIINRTILSLYIYTFFVKLGQIFIRIYKGSFKKEKKGGEGSKRNGKQREISDVVGNDVVRHGAWGGRK